MIEICKARMQPYGIIVRKLDFPSSGSVDEIRRLMAANARDGEKIEPGRIYVAPPDRHLILDSGGVRVTKGPKENRFRPAVDLSILSSL